MPVNCLEFGHRGDGVQTCKVQSPRPCSHFSWGEATWTPKVCKIMAFMDAIWGLGLFFYILLGFG